MPPKRGHARKVSTASSSPQPITNHVTPSLSSSSPPPAAASPVTSSFSTATTKASAAPTSSPLPMTLMGRREKLSTPVRLLLLPVIAMTTSAVLYTGASFVVKMEQLGDVTKEPELWRQVVPVVTRILGLYAQWFLGFDAINTFAVTLHVRLPFYFLLYLFYGISLQTVTTSAVIDAASYAIAFFVLNRRRPANYASRAAAKSTEASAVYDLTNVVVLTGLATSIFGVVLFVLSATKLPEWVILSFDSVLTVERPHEFHLGQFLALALPLGWSLREFVFGPATSVDSTSHKRQLTATITSRAMVLSLLSYVETFVRTYTAVEGASVSGAGFWATIWSLLIWLVGAALVSATEAAEPEEFDMDEDEVNGGHELALRDSAVVPERSTRKRGSTKVSI